MSDYQLGGLYLARNEDDSFSVIKIIAIDENGVHLRLYANVYEEKPADIDPSELTIGGVGWLEGIGVGHLPISHENLREWEISFVKTLPLEEEELEDYESWKLAGGGYW